MAERVYNERYRLERHVARGGMAEVYLARDLLLDRPVALKVPFPELSADGAFVERFRREARAAAKLNHPGIVAVYDWGEEEGTYFIVMEYVEGQTLHETIANEGPLDPDRAAAIAADIAAALAFAHRSGVIHRDVKPGNVIISPSGQVKVTDFGIARAGNPQDRLTQTGAVMGTATYFSPEQAQGHDIDPRSDVYSLGVVLYEMLTGRPPFVGESPVAVAYQHVREPPPPIGRYNPEVPEALAAIVQKAMAKDPRERYASAEELSADLVRFRQRAPVAALPSDGEQAAAVGAAAGAAGAVTRVQDPVGATRVQEVPAGATEVAARPVVVEEAGGPAGRRRPWPYLAALAAVVVVALALVALASVGRSGSDNRVEVPDVTGQGVDQARRALAEKDLDVAEQPRPDHGPPGRVLEQDPAPGAEVDKGSRVNLTVSQPLPTTTTTRRPATTRPRPTATLPATTAPPPPTEPVTVPPTEPPPTDPPTSLTLPRPTRTSRTTTD